MDSRNRTASAYYYETPMWAVAALCCGALAGAVLCVLAFFNLDWARHGPAFLKWFVLLIGLVALLAGARPLNWQPWIAFYADGAGLHFPSACPATADATWLLVPWSRVGGIAQASLRGNSRGISIELALQDDEIQGYFRNVRLAKELLGQEVRSNGYFKVGYSNAFKRIDTAVRLLNDFKHQRA